MKNLEPYQLRMLNERANLVSLVEKMVGFSDQYEYYNVSLEEQERIDRQLEIMGDYLNILNERIKAIDA